MVTGTLRADAARNRSALIRAAKTEFADRGLDAPLDDIARRAGLGNATLYRHFPTRCALLAAVFQDALGEIVAESERHLADPDPWNGFREHLVFLCGLQAGNRALADLLVSTLTGAPELERLRGQCFHAAVQLVRRAQLSGQLRTDLRHEDLVVLLMSNAGLLERTRTTAPTAWRRHLDFVLDGLVPTHAQATPGPGAPAVRAAMGRLAERLKIR